MSIYAFILNEQFSSYATAHTHGVAPLTLELWDAAQHQMQAVSDHITAVANDVLHVAQSVEVGLSGSTDREAALKREYAPSIHFFLPFLFDL